MHQFLLDALVKRAHEFTNLELKTSHCLILKPFSIINVSHLHIVELPLFEHKADLEGISEVWVQVIVHYLSFCYLGLSISLSIELKRYGLTHFL